MNTDRITELNAILKDLYEDEYMCEMDGHVPQALRFRIAELERELKTLKGE